MLEELKQGGSSTAFKRSICGLLGAGAFSVIIFFNLFGLDEEAISRWRGIALAMCALVAIGSIANWLRAAKAGAVKDIENFCKTTDNPSATMARLDKTWREGNRFKTVRMDSEYVICHIGMRAEVISLGDIFWAYKYVSKTNNVEYARLEIVPRAGKRQSYKLNHDQAVIDAIVKHIAENCPNAIMGYSDEMELLYRKKDLAGLREYALSKKFGM